MEPFGTFLVGLAIAVGVVGAVIQILPSGIIIGAAILIWAIMWNNTAAWIVFAIAAVVLAVAMVLKYVVPGKRLVASGIPKTTFVAAIVGGVIGWIVGLPLGFVVGIVGGTYAAEYHRTRSGQEAWASTKTALAAIGLTVIIELIAALTAATAWGIGLFFV
ncbi:DUF456 domain-containing protein [Schaalia vaccimaxillae]|uniref:DUF456 domain-containing protein n=1 Tax=Schaalia vaccimaxillae TaxID=183916 RepID=UPI0003B6558F|nr:DUF456 domain-containing protein [Schaalia vaccimaxillae]